MQHLPYPRLPRYVHLKNTLISEAHLKHALICCFKGDLYEFEEKEIMVRSFEAEEVGERGRMGGALSGE